MRAIRFHEFGGPEVLVLDNVPDPQPATGEVLVRIEASGVNPTDATTRAGRANRPPGFAFPAMLGRECAGVVQAVGGSVTRVAVGDRVVVRDTAYSYAELLAAPEANVYKIPDGLGTIEASTVAVTYCTAWDAVVNRANAQPGENVLVHGAAGGVGIAAVQIASHIGAKVIGTASTAEKLAWIAGHGADHGVNYSEGDFVEEVKSLTGGRGADVVIDGVGGDTLLRSFDCLAPGGRIATYGASSGREVTVNLSTFSRPRISLLGAGSRGSTQQDFEHILGLLAKGTLKATVDRTWPLAEASEAHRYLADRRVKGKVALTTG